MLFRSQSRSCGVSAFPNPFTNECILTSPFDKINNEIEYEAFDLWGNVMEKRMINGLVNNFQIGSHWLPGIYFLKVKNVDTICALRLIKQ